jgi:hypothetical protein
MKPAESSPKDDNCHFSFHHQGGSVAKRVNYGFERRQKEIKRQKKKEEKAERKRLKNKSEELTQDDAVREDDETDREPSSAEEPNEHGL